MSAYPEADARILNHLNSWSVPEEKSIDRKIRWSEVSTDDEGIIVLGLRVRYRRSLTLRDARVPRNYRLPMKIGMRRLMPMRDHDRYYG